MNKYIKGTCMEMCPAEEIDMRERENLLHVLETVPGTENSRSPMVNRHLVVKSFSRSAAGKTMDKPENLRPPEVLLRVVSYLLFDVINSDRLPLYAICDFITDRLMAVRQDMVVQNVSKAESITILQPIIRFHAYAAYKLCNEKLNNFDPDINRNHLQECLKKLLNLYDACSVLQVQSDKCYDYLIENRPEFEALYVVFNLGNEEALRRAITLPEIYKTKIVKMAIRISVSCMFGNFIRICRLMKNLPPLIGAVASLHLPKIRRKTLRTMSVAYHSKNLTFPLSHLKDILLYGSEFELIQDCEYYGIRTDKQTVYFSKQSFIAEKPVRTPKQESFIDDKLNKENVHCILLK